MKFLLDENVHVGLFSFLSKLGHDVKFSSKGIENSKVFDLAVREGRVIVTRDTHFSNTSAYKPSKHFGVFLLRIPPQNVEEQERAISKLLKSSKNFKGRVVVLLSHEKFEFLR